MEKAVVVFSGGQDSTTCLLWALEEFDEVETVTFLYGQRHEAEVECAQMIAKELGVKQKIIEMDLLNQLTENALTRKDMKIEEDVIPNTYVEGRNHIFLSFAAIYAQTIGAKNIITGVSETESSGYPDCRNAFIQSLNTTLNLAMDAELTFDHPPYVQRQSSCLGNGRSNGKTSVHSRKHLNLLQWCNRRWLRRLPFL